MSQTFTTCDCLTMIKKNDDSCLVKKFIEENNLNVNAKCNKNAALTVAVDYEKYDHVEYLLTFPDLDVNIVNQYHESALMIACLRDNARLVKMLLADDRIDISSTNSDGKFPLYSCRDGPCLDMLLADPRTDVNQQVQKKFQNPETRFMKAVGSADTVVMKKLLQHPRININKQNADGETALFFIRHAWWSMSPVGWRDAMAPLLEDNRVYLSQRNNEGLTVKDVLGCDEVVKEYFDEFQEKRLHSAKQQMKALDEALPWPEGLLEIHLQKFLFVKI